MPADQDNTQPKLWMVAFDKQTKNMVEKPGYFTTASGGVGKDPIRKFISLTWSKSDDRPFMERYYNLVDPTLSFMARLELTSWDSKDSGSSHVFLKDVATGIVYPIFFRAYMSCISRAEYCNYGIITGQWGYEKKGPRQGIYMIDELVV